VLGVKLRYHLFYSISSIPRVLIQSTDSKKKSRWRKAQSQGQYPALTDPNYFTGQDPLPPIVVTAQYLPGAEITVTSSSTAESISTAAGGAGIGLGIGDFSSGTTAIGTNWRIYSAPRGNQYFTTLTKLDTVFKVFGAGALVVGTFADYYDAFAEGGSIGQAN